MEVRAIAIGLPQHHFHGITAIIGDRDVGRLVVVAVVFWTPGGIEKQFQAACGRT